MRHINFFLMKVEHQLHIHYTVYQAVTELPEKVAIYQASSQYPNEEIEMIAISGTAQTPTAYPVSPCGACRQSLSEYETKQQKLIAVYFMGAEGNIIQTDSIKDLLPFLFDGSLM